MVGRLKAKGDARSAALNKRAVWLAANDKSLGRMIKITNVGDIFDVSLDDGCDVIPIPS